MDRRARQTDQLEGNMANEWKPEKQKTLQRANRNRGYYARGAPRLGRKQTRRTTYKSKLKQFCPLEKKL